MIYKRAIASIFILILFASLTGCPATIKPGEDPVLVEAQRIYRLTINVADFLFTTEDQNQAVLEAAIPGTHAVVERLRLRVRDGLPALLRAIDAYALAQSAPNKDALLVTQSVVKIILEEMQRIVADLPTTPPPTPTPR